MRVERPRIDLESFFDVRRSPCKFSRLQLQSGFEGQRVNQIWINLRARDSSAAAISVATFNPLVQGHVQMCARAVWIQLQRFVKKLSGVTVVVFLGEQLAGAQLRFEISRVDLDGRSIDFVRVLESFQVHQGPRDNGQLAAVSGLFSL